MHGTKNPLNPSLLRTLKDALSSSSFESCNTTKNPLNVYSGKILKGPISYCKDPLHPLNTKDASIWKDCAILCYYGLLIRRRTYQFQLNKLYILLIPELKVYLSLSKDFKMRFGWSHFVEYSRMNALCSVTLQIPDQSLPVASMYGWWQGLLTSNNNLIWSTQSVSPREISHKCVNL